MAVCHMCLQAISRMEAMNPPPRLFMRSVNIMVTHAAVPLIKWVITLLERLIQKQVRQGNRKLPCLMLMRTHTCGFCCTCSASNGAEANTKQVRQAAG